MSYWLNERVVIKYDAEEPRVVDAIHDVLEKEGFGEIDLILEVGKIEFTINKGVTASFSISDLIEKLHHCDEDVSSVCSIDLESNLGYYPVIYSSGSKPADVYSLYSDFIDEVKRNLDASVKNLLTEVL